MIILWLGQAILNFQQCKTNEHFLNANYFTMKWIFLKKIHLTCLWKYYPTCGETVLVTFCKSCVKDFTANKNPRLSVRNGTIETNDFFFGGSLNAEAISRIWKQLNNCGKKWIGEKLKKNDCSNESCFLQFLQILFYPFFTDDGHDFPFD